MRPTTVFLKIWEWLTQPFNWGKWIDIQTFHFASDGYLLQGRVNNITNAKQFRITRFRQSSKFMVDSPCPPLERLKEVGL